MDQLIGDKKFVVGDDLTIADLSIAHSTSMLGYNEFKDCEEMPNLMTWYNGIKEVSSHFKDSCDKAREAYEKWLEDKQKEGTE